MLHVHGAEDSILSRCQFFPLDVYIQRNPNQNPSKLFYGYQQIDSKVYMKRQKTQNSQYNTEGEEQNWRTDTVQCQDLL